MATEVGICNLALSHLGDVAEVTSISPPDGTTQATHCALFYPIARDTLIARHPWNFTLTRSVANVATATVPETWDYQFAVPTHVIFLGVYDEEDTQDRTPQDYIIEGDYLYTNIETPTFRYTQQITDTTKFPPLFTVALARYLASMLAGPIIKGGEGMQVAKAQLQWFEQMDFPEAKKADAKTQRGNLQYSDFTPSGIGARA